MIDVLKELGGGAISTAAFLLLYWGVRFLVLRVHARGREKVAELTLTGQRDRRALEETESAFARLERQLDRAESRCTSLEAALAEERKIKGEALEDAAHAKRMLDDAILGFTLARKTMEADIHAGLWREKQAVVWIRAAVRAWAALQPRLRRRGDADLPELPPVPYWVEQRDPSEPPALPPPDED